MPEVQHLSKEDISILGGEDFQDPFFHPQESTKMNPSSSAAFIKWLNCQETDEDGLLFMNKPTKAELNTLWVPTGDQNWLWKMKSSSVHYHNACDLVTMIESLAGGHISLKRTQQNYAQCLFPVDQIKIMSLV